MLLHANSGKKNLLCLLDDIFLQITSIVDDLLHFDL